MTTEGEDIAPRASVSDFDPHRLSGFLRDRLGFDGPVSLDRIAGGQSNPTYFVTFPGRRLVLRKRPSGATLRSAHAIDREYRVLKALEETEVPVPRAVLYHDDSNIVGTPFYLMERLEGRVFHDCALPGLLPSERRAIYLDVAATLAKLHAVDPAVVGLGDYGRPGNYFERQIQRWSRQWANSPDQGDTRARSTGRLAACAPSSGRR